MSQRYQVVTNVGGQVEYVEAESVSVADTGHLYLNAEDVVVACFAPREWAYFRIAELP